MEDSQLKQKLLDQFSDQDITKSDQRHNNLSTQIDGFTFYQKSQILNDSNQIEYPIIKIKEETSNDNKEQELQKEIKKKTDWLDYTLLFTTFMLNVGYMLVAPFFPVIASNKGVSEIKIGLIIAAFPFAGFFAALFIGEKMRFIGRKKAILFALVAEIFGNLLTAFSVYFENQIIFITLMIATRMLMGISWSVYVSCQLSIITIIYPDQIRQKIAIIQAANGLGILIGPFIGSALFYIGHYILGTDEGGFQICFYGITILYIVLLPLCYYQIPSQLIDNTTQQKSKANILNFLFKFPIFVTFVVYIINSSSISYLEPLLTQHLQDYGLSTEIASLLFGIAAITYIPCLYLSSYYPKNLDQRLMIIFGMIFTIMSQFFCGPDSNFLPNKLYIVIIGLIFIGIGQAFTLIPVIPEFIYLGRQYLQEEEDQEAINDFSSSLFEAQFSLSGIIGPIVGGYLKQQFDFQFTATIIAYCLIISMMLYLLLGGTYKAIISPKKRHYIRSLKSLSCDENN